ncbi:hypothetical protein Pta02_35780 [Planobispora takensis]|uniref:Uncharacterized protein n=1 Tax=Planobispora takensis TaxID=1367882 RepID=A0A8J3WTU3_9ACTN|nr:hypothetical protein Pta02_35780 [Planobispora takensis]
MAPATIPARPPTARKSIAPVMTATRISRLSKRPLPPDPWCPPGPATVPAEEDSPAVGALTFPITLTP